MLTPSEGGRRRSGEKGARVPRAMPPRRRRDGAAVQARTREQSPARVRVPSRQKAPWSFRRCHPSRGGIRGGPRPERRASRFIQTTRHIEPVTRVPGASREGHALHRQKSARTTPLLERLGPRFASSAQAERVGVKAGASGSRLAGPRCGNAPQRPTQPGIGWCQASSGAKAPLACEDRQLEGRARTSTRLQKSASDDRGREKRVPRWQREHVDGGPALAGSQKDSRGCKGVGSGKRGGQATGLAKSGAGRPRGRCGAKVLDRWKAPWIVQRFASFTRADSGGLGGLHESVRSASSTGSGQEATGVSEVRFSRIATGRQRPTR